MKYSAAKKISIICIAILLTACAPKPLTKYYPENQESNSRPVLIMDLHKADHVIITKIDKNYTNKSKRKSYTVVATTKFLNLGSYRDAIFSMEPGVYVISYAQFNTGNYIFETTLDGVNSAGYVNYGAFKIKSGDIVYLGDISFNWESSVPGKKAIAKDFIVIKNNIEKVKQDLVGTKYSNLISKLHKTEFYPVGSKITLDQITSE